MKQQLLDILNSIEKPGSFCSSHEILPVFLDLNIVNVGEIGLPLSKSQAQEIIAQCHQAPYGKGTKTIVDTNVRKVWELNPEQFEIKNPSPNRYTNDKTFLKMGGWKIPTPYRRISIVSFFYDKLS